jgi:hypothetical protein
VVKPKDWRGEPDTANRREVRHQVWKAQQVWTKNLESKTLPYTPLSIPNLLQSSSSNHTRKYNPAHWKDQPLGQKDANSFFVDFYPNPYEHSNDSIAFNPWNPQIIELCYAHYYLNEGFQLLADHMLTPELWNFIDGFDEDDDTRHFFYTHCLYFRYLNSTKLIHAQGFSCECVHQDTQSLTYPYPVRAPMIPHNPLLTPEEDEFLHHASYVFKGIGELEMANVLCQVRAAVPFMPGDASLLFNAGYLTPMIQYNNQGAKYALLWDAPALTL